MASSSDNSSSDDDDDSTFFDANSSLSNIETTTPLQHEPRWRISSINESLKRPDRFYTLSLTENQIHDIERRDKLQRLRAQETADYRANQNALHKTSTESFAILSPSSLSSIRRQESNGDETPSAPDLLKDHLDGDHVRRQHKNSATSISKPVLINSAPVSSDYHQQRSLPYTTLPAATSVRATTSYYSSAKTSSAISEPNIVDLNLIDRVTKFGELLPYSQKLNDEEILRQPIVRNLDSGKYIPLCDANPMTQTIMERAHGSASVISTRHTSILINSNLRRNSTDNHNHTLNGMNSTEGHSVRRKTKIKGGEQDDDEEDDDDENESTSSATSSTKSSHTTAVSSSSAASKSSTSAVRTASSLFHGGKRQLTKLVVRNFLRRGAKKTTSDRHDIADVNDDEDDGERVLINDGSNGDLKYKASRNSKEQAQFDRTQLLQTIVNAHDGPIWCMRFSPNDHLLATGGQDCLLKVWVLKSAQEHFSDFTRSTSNSSKQQNETLAKRFSDFYQMVSTETMPTTINARLGLSEHQAPLYAKPFCKLIGHQAPVLDVAWSKSLFLLSSSMDKTVRLWHLSRLECLCFFRHVDFVSAIAFHPRDDRYFVSASLDGHVRLWNIPDKRVVHWTLIPAQASSQITAAQANLITAVNFCDEGRKVTVGTFDGRFLLYTDSLQYDTVMNIGDKDGSRSHRSRKKRRKPCKITGIESMNSNNSKVLITSNDSRIRVYDIRTREIERKYRGYSNQSSQIRASFSHDDQYIISGSEDSWFYIWKTEPNNALNHRGASAATSKLTRKQRRHFDRAFERIRVHNTMVTSAIFAPNPLSIMEHLHSSNEPSSLLSRSANSQSRSLLPQATTPNVNTNRARLICTHGTASPTEGTMSTNHPGPTYVMVTADSKGQLKLLVNRFQR